MFGRGKDKQTSRERSELRRHLRDLGELREERLRELGDLAYEMQRSGRVLRDPLWKKAAEVAALDDEAELVHRGLKERLTIAQLGELGPTGLSSGSSDPQAAGDAPKRPPPEPGGE
ncbi:MAG: hypothetical protein U0R52_00420 [Solirubrobacterales bacterium]